jgi:hypothetical protein
MKIGNLFRRIVLRKPQNRWVWYHNNEDEERKLKTGDELEYIVISNDNVSEMFTAVAFPIKILNVTGDIVEIRLDVSKYTAVSMKDIVDYRII